MAASVEFIEYNGKKYPIKLGIYSLMVLQKKEGISLEDIESDPELYEPILFMALQQGAQITKQELDLNREDMNIVLIECFVEFNLILPKFFPEEMLGKLTEVGGIAEALPAKKPVKKKSTTKNLQPKP